MSLRKSTDDRSNGAHFFEAAIKNKIFDKAGVARFDLWAFEGAEINSDILSFLAFNTTI